MQRAADGSGIATERAARALRSAHAFADLPLTEKIALVRSGTQAPAPAIERARVLVMLGRPRTCVPGMLTYVLGAGYVGAEPSARVAMQAALCFMGGFIANLENTYTDLEEDCNNLPGRVYQLLRIGHTRFRAVIVATNLAMLAAAAMLDIYNLIFMALALGLVHQYSFRPLRAKARPVAGLLVFTGVVTYPFFVGMLALPGPGSLAWFLGGVRAWLGGGSPSPASREAIAFLAMGAFIAAWFGAKGMFKNVPDYAGDRAAGLRTSATMFATRRGAALAASAATTGAYASLAVLVAIDLAPARLLFALLWLPLVLYNCARLVATTDGARGNACLKTDMVISAGFIATVVLVSRMSTLSVAAVACGGLIIVISDWLGIDSRRAEDATRDPPSPGSAPILGAAPRARDASTRS